MARWRRMAPSRLCCRWSCPGGDALSSLPLDGFAYEGQSSHARRIDALSQGIGYLAAGAGPFIFGRLLQASGGWTAPFVFFTAVILLWGLCVRLADTHQTVD